MLNEENFGKRLAELRIQANVSARDMSLSIGQSESYINKIENGKSFPSMQTFFYICDYLKMSPQDFFNDEISNPNAMSEAIHHLEKLDDEQFKNILNIIKGLSK